KDQLGIKGAFTSAGFDSSSDWRFKAHLANIPLSYEFQEDGVTTQPETIKGTYLPNFKNIFDLYLKDSTTAPSQLSSKTG
ncbi:carbohydrate ABC transporter substrate-binding protein, partial [Escherichia coli]|nr:carbohydrate ABC transporter substrate-binding protein [Escherichia coli]